MSLSDPSFPPPIPVQAYYAYSPTDSRRPGIVTAIGVICITVACLSGLTSFIGGMYSVGLYFVSQAQSRMTTMRSPTYVSSSTAVAGPSSNNSPALPGGDASVAVNALDSMLSLDNAHLRELDRLMRRHGREVFGGDDDTPLTAASVREAVSDSKPLSKSSGKAQFSTEKGTVEIYPDHAVFTSAHSAKTVDTSARHNRDQVSHSNSATSFTSAVVVGGPPVATTLTTAQIDQAVKAAKAFGTPITSAQLKSLRRELAKPNQGLVTPTGTSPVISVVTQANGNLAIYFDTGNMLILDPRAKVILSGPMPMPNFGVSASLATMNTIEAIASIGLAIYLLIVGIMVLRGSFLAPRLLRIYALIKIPLAIVGGVGLTMLGYALSNALTNNLAMGMSGSPASPKAGYIMAGVVATLLGLALPIGLLIALRSKTVRNYYNAVAPMP